MDVVIDDGDEDETFRKQLEIAAIGDYDLGFTSYHYLIMAEEGLRSFSDNNLNMYYRIFADKKMEGLFYTAGTLVVAVGGGSVAGYPVFLWARNHGMFNIRNYHYPLAATLIMIAVLIFVQVIMVFVIGKSVKKDSLIDRIRFDS